jgi:hypothetical protein
VNVRRRIGHAGMVRTCAGCVAVEMEAASLAAACDEPVAQVRASRQRPQIVQVLGIDYAGECGTGLGAPLDWSRAGPGTAAG